MLDLPGGSLAITIAPIFLAQWVMPSRHGQARGFRRGGKATLRCLSLMLSLSGLSCATSTPASLNSLEIGQDQSDYAAYYEREAIVMRQRAEDYAAQVQLYEQLFGPQSDWVRGARLLSRFYEDSAREKERLADVHRRLSPRSQPSFP
jgi:hypothetical protein